MMSMFDLVMRGWSDGAVMASMDPEYVDDPVYRRGYSSGRNARLAYEDTVLVVLHQQDILRVEAVSMVTDEPTPSLELDAVEGRR